MSDSRKVIIELEDVFSGYTVGALSLNIKDATTVGQILFDLDTVNSSVHTLPNSGQRLKLRVA